MLNHIEIMGRLVRDPELKVTDNGVHMCQFSVAVDRDVPNRETGKRDTDFFDCTAWRAGADFVSKYHKRGDLIVVTGRLKSHKRTSREGFSYWHWDLEVENTYFGEKKQKADDRNEDQEERHRNADIFSAAPSMGFADITDEEDGEIPF